MFCSVRTLNHAENVASFPTVLARAACSGEQAAEMGTCRDFTRSGGGGKKHYPLQLTIFNELIALTKVMTHYKGYVMQAFGYLTGKQHGIRSHHFQPFSRLMARV